MPDVDANLGPRIAGGDRLGDDEARELAHVPDLAALMAAASVARDAGFGDAQTYSRKVFIPLTQLCRDTCHYCTFAKAPRELAHAYLDPDRVLEIAREGARAGCKEALFTLGDKPELRYDAARRALAHLGHATTLDYLRAAAELVLRETGLLPHLNPGVLTAQDYALLRPVSVSMGLMLETAAERLSLRGGPHFGSPDKVPSVRLASIAAAGAARVPFTSGILIGIGETRAERIEALLALRDLHERHGHLQEVIVQNFCAKPGTRMARASEPREDDHLWTIAVARLVFGPGMTIQAPPNLRAPALPRMIEAGIDDWGGVSPVTIDHVNPEKPWPAIDALADATWGAGRVLVERLAIHPRFAVEGARWLAPQIEPAVRRLCDAEGFARDDPWLAGGALAPAKIPAQREPPAVVTPARRALARAIDTAVAGRGIDAAQIAALFAARGDDFRAVCQAADALRAEVAGDRVTYVVNRNINYTNICAFRCQFCAFSKGRGSDDLRGAPYDLDLAEIASRVREAAERGATEVCLQGGIHPSYTGATYLSIARAVKAAVPSMHVHAFSPLEVMHGARTRGMPVTAFLRELKDAGLGSLPGTAAEILDDDVRRVICPDKLTSGEWLEVVESAHRVGLRTTATIMFGHVERVEHWARHLLSIREIQSRTGGFTEFVPLPFVAMEAPMFRKGRSRNGPTLREAVLMHAVARLALHPGVRNVQTSWVKMGPKGALLCLRAGANDFGGTLMNESITRAAGAVHGQEMLPATLAKLIVSIGRRPAQRTTLYADVEPGTAVAA
ncbi:MAG: 5-amino-6-(D-ribitylamino)uracil--L-tyrosine 4-hydroxyphenyl transferase CofH [Burkholderiales bacterium]